MQRINFREILEKSIDFMKLHYEHLLPFSFLFLVLFLLSTFIKSGVSTLVLLLTLPLMFSVAVYASKLEQGEEKKFTKLFDVYKSFNEFFAVTIMKWFVIIILLTPFFYLYFDLLKEFDFDQNKLLKALESKQILPTQKQFVTTLVSMLLILFVSPFLLFLEHFAVIDRYGVKDCFYHSYHMGYRYYIRLFALMILQAFALSLVTFITCGFAFIVVFPLFNLIFYYIYKEYKLKYVLK